MLKEEANLLQHAVGDYLVSKKEEALDNEGVREAAEKLLHDPGSIQDDQTRVTLGIFYSCRMMFTPDEEQMKELVLALVCLHPTYHQIDEELPGPVYKVMRFIEGRSSEYPEFIVRQFEVWYHLAWLASQIFEELHDRDALTVEIMLVRQIISLAEDADSAFSVVRTLSGRLALYHFEFDNPDNLDESISILCQVLIGDSKYSERIATQLADTIRRAFEHDGNAAYIAKSMEALGRLSVLPDDVVWYLDALAEGLNTKFTSTGDPKLISSVIDINRLVLNRRPAGIEIWRVEANLSNALCRAAAFGDHAHLDEAIELARTALGRVDAASPLLSGVLLTAGHVLTTRYTEEKSLADRDEAVDYLQRAADLGGEHWLAALHRLAGLVASAPPGDALWSRSDLLATLRRVVGLDPDSVDGWHVMAVAFVTHGTVLAPERGIVGGDVLADITLVAGKLVARRTEFLNGLEETGSFSSLISYLYHQDADPMCFDGLIQDLREWVTKSGQGAQALAVGLQGLGDLLSRRYSVSGSVRDSSEALSCYRSAFAQNPTPAQQSGITTQLTQVLRPLLQDRFNKLGRIEDIDELIGLDRTLMSWTDDDDEPAASALWNLGLSLAFRAKIVSVTPGMDEAIITMRRVLDLQVQLGIEDRDTLSGLGDTHRERFMLRGDLDDIDRAVKFTRKAVDGADEGEGRLAAWQNNLCAALQTRFRSTGDPEDIAAAAIAGYRSTESGPEDDPQRHIHLQNLFGCLRILALASNSERDWDEAIRVGVEAVHLVSADAPHLATYLANLSGAAMTKFWATRARADIDLSVSFAREAVKLGEAYGEEGPLYARFSLAQALKARWEHTGSAADLDESYSSYLEAAARDSSAFWMRVRAAIEGGRLAASARRWTEALEAFDRAIGLLPQLVSLQLSQQSREHWLSDVSGLATDAAACAIELGLEDKAVALLERGRALLMTEALGHRAAVERLRRTHPSHAARFDALRRELRQSHVGNEDENFGGFTDARLKISRELAALVTEIQALDGVEDFLMPAEADTLATPIAGGVAVIVNVSEFRSDAIIIDDAGLRTTRLWWLTPKVVRFQLDTFTEALTDCESAWKDRNEYDFNAAQQVLCNCLEWLWKSVVGPADQEITRPDRNNPVRVWWIPTGLLSFLPLHAASSADRSAVDLFTSSYAFTLRAIRQGNRKVSRAVTATPLVVAMPETPGASALPHVMDEVAELRTIFGEVIDLVGHEATYPAVAAGLRHRRIAHFACHACPGTETPSDGELLLCDRATKKFSVVALNTLDLVDADLAFLSACETLRTNANLADEGISIGSSFQVAGFRHVVGTMWKIADVAAVQVVRHFYGALTASDETDVAESLHSTVCLMRQMYPNLPSIWAGYVHYGR
jgi:tetratricopeptide (TPR) repeat protein